MRQVITSLSCVISMLLLLSNCEKVSIDSIDSADHWKQAENRSQIKILTTTAMVADLVKNIGGDLVAVKALMGSGIDPHSYQTKLGDAVLLQQADIIFYNGLHLEGKMEGSLEQITNKPVTAITSQLTEQELLKPQVSYSDHNDPHVWGDPLVWASCIQPVLETLINYDFQNADTYKSNALAYTGELHKLHTWAQSMINTIPEKERYLILVMMLFSI